MANGTKTFSEDEIAASLREQVGYKASQAKIAKQLGISRSYLNEVLSGRKKVGPIILKALGYDATPRYQKLNGHGGRGGK